MSSEPPTDPEILKVEHYRYWTSVWQARCQMQHKCVEMSLTITAALAAALCALMSKTDPPINLLVVVLFLYTVLESLILANYLYHTFTLTLISLSRNIMEPVPEIVAAKLESDPKPSQQLDATLTNCFQPLMIYGSIALGWLGFAASVSWAAWSSSVWLSCSAFLAIMFLACCELCFLYRLHKNSEHFAKSWCWILVHVEEKDRGLLKVWRRARSGAK